jgi:hypothetical protein
VALQVDVGEIDERGVAGREAVEREVDHAPRVRAARAPPGEVVVVVEHAVLQRLGLLGHALRVEEAEVREQVVDERVGAGERHRGARGRDVHGRRVHAEARRELLRVEAHRARHRDESHRQRVVVDGDPVRPLALSQQRALVADLDHRGLAVGGEVDRHTLGEILAVAGHRAGLEMELVGRTAQDRVHRVGRAVEIEVLDAHELHVALHLLGGRLVGVERVGAVAAAHVHRSHPAEHVRLRRRRREVARDPVHLDVYAVLLEHVPPRRPAAVVGHLGRRGRDHVAEHVQRAAGIADGWRRGGDRLVGGRIAVDEVEDPVPAGIHPGDEARPRDRTLRRRRGAERLVRALVAELREVRHLAARDHLLEDHRIHPVDADDEHARLLGRGVRGGRHDQRGDRASQSAHDPLLARRPGSGKILAPGAEPLCARLVGSSIPATGACAPCSAKIISPCM